MTDNTNVLINNELLVKALAAMPNKLTLESFQQLCEITSRATTEELANYLVYLGIGEFSDSSVTFSEKDKLDTILLAMKQGCDPESLSKKILWNDFELFTSLLIESAGYSYERNAVFTNPRIQIDVIGFYHKIALLIDCKHWMKIHDFDISKFSSNQSRRAKIFLDKRKDVESAIPIIVTLHEYDYSFFDKIPIVPISRFKEFLQNFPLYLDRLHFVQNK